MCIRDRDVYVAPSQIRRFGLRTGDMVDGFQKANPDDNKYDALIRINTINGVNPELCSHRPNFEKLTPVFPNSRLSMEVEGGSTALRIVDLISPIGKGQRGMIVSPPKAGKTTLLKEIANAVTHNYPDMHLIILLIDERPEEVTDIRESIQGEHVEVIYSTFDETPEHHKQVAEMVLERAKRLVEHKQDVMVLLDSLTRLARAYNLTVTPSGRTLSGGLDPAALHMPKKFFGAARNMREGGSLTILATALVDTGSRLDDMVFEEFKGTGNMELVLDRKLSERRIFPAIDITRSGTRREDLLLTPDELTAVSTIRKSISGLKKMCIRDRVHYPLPPALTLKLHRLQCKVGLTQSCQIVLAPVRVNHSRKTAPIHDCLLHFSLPPKALHLKCRTLSPVQNFRNERATQLCSHFPCTHQQDLPLAYPLHMKALSLQASLYPASVSKQQGLQRTLTP